MKAITIQQPWASLIACGAKRFETRAWKARHSGPLAIHAGRRPKRAGMTAIAWYLAQTSYQNALHELATDGFLVQPWDLPFGAIIAVVNMDACYPAECLTLEDVLKERAFGDFTPGRYAWRLDEVKPLKCPVACLGKQGLWEWDETTKEKETTV